jgi:hypothetical protein
MKEIKVEICISGEGISEDKVTDALIDLCESKGWEMGGGVTELEEGANLSQVVPVTNNFSDLDMIGFAKWYCQRDFTDDMNYTDRLNEYLKKSSRVLQNVEPKGDTEIYGNRIEYFVNEYNELLKKYNDLKYKTDSVVPVERYVDLIKAQDEYINFLGDSYNKAYSIARAHHFVCSDEDFDKGVKLRAVIERLKKTTITK